MVLAPTWAPAASCSWRQFRRPTRPEVIVLKFFCNVTASPLVVASEKKRKNKCFSAIVRYSARGNFVFLITGWEELTPFDLKLLWVHLILIANKIRTSLLNLLTCFPFFSVKLTPAHFWCCQLNTSKVLTTSGTPLLLHSCPKNGSPLFLN